MNIAMQRNIINSILLLTLACLISCDSAGTDGSDSTVSSGKAAYLIDITEPFATDSLISPRELLTNVEYIKLKSPNKFFLTEAKKILELDYKLFILDKNKKIVVAYDLAGNFIGQVGKKGTGPQEYRSVMDFAVDPKNNSILIFSSADQSILEFTSDLTFRKKIRINAFASQMSLLTSGNFAFYTYFDHDGANILIYNREGKQIGSRIPYPKNGNYTPMNYTGFLVGDFYTYPLSSTIFRLEENKPTDSEKFEIVIPNRWPEDKKFAHDEFLNSPWTKRIVLSKFSIGNKANELLFYYFYEENGNAGIALGAKLSSGQVFGHFNLKHGFKSHSDQFFKLFFIGPYNLPTFSESSGYYYTAATNERMEEFYSGDQHTALNEIKQIDYNLYKVLKESSASENPILMRFKLRKEL